MEGGHPPFFDEKQCKHMQSQIPVCLGLVEKCNHPKNGGGYNSLACQTASSFCEGALSSPWESTGRCEYRSIKERIKSKLLFLFSRS